MSENKPVVSIACLTYNHEGFIREALDGIVMQRAAFPFEAIVHDDASTDRTPAIVRVYAERFPEIVRPIFQAENQLTKTGRYPLINCFAAARGRYIAICDGDDYWMDPLKLQMQVDWMERHPGTILCYHDYLFLMADGSLVQPSSERPRDYTADELVGFPLTGYGMTPSTMLFRNVYRDEDRAEWEAFGADYPLKVFLGTMGLGGADHVPGIDPTVKRKHPSSSWCSLPRQEIATRTRQMHRRLHGLITEKGNPHHIKLREAFL